MQILQQTMDKPKNSKDLSPKTSLLKQFKNKKNASQISSFFSKTQELIFQSFKIFMIQKKSNIIP